MVRARPAFHGSADLIGSLVRRHGAELPISEIVRSSWSRCVNNYALDPYEKRRPNSVDEADLRVTATELIAAIPLGRPGRPEEAAGGVFFLCSPWSNYVHGQVLNVTGGQFTGMTS